MADLHQTQDGQRCHKSYHMLRCRVLIVVVPQSVHYLLELVGCSVRPGVPQSGRGLDLSHHPKCSHGLPQICWLCFHITMGTI